MRLYGELIRHRTVRAMMTENSNKNTQAQAFSYFAFSGNMGIFFGPLIGGVLESPAEKYKSTFGHVRFFRDYPYALPGFASASVGLVALILTTLFVKEVGRPLTHGEIMLTRLGRLCTSVLTKRSPTNPPSPYPRGSFSITQASGRSSSSTIT
jgi:MFS family permease